VSDKSLATLFSELFQLVVRYVRQEVTDPLKGAGRYIKLGLIGGALGTGAGIVLSVGGLRAVQTATVFDIDRGAWSWLVYIVMGLVCLVVGALSVVLGVRVGRSTR
jgi:hypothetical protein